ncbi:MAG: hypothetical protein ACT4PZ_19780 [Panacagrimonas sp.]
MGNIGSFSGSVVLGLAALAFLTGAEAQVLGAAERAASRAAKQAAERQAAAATQRAANNAADRVVRRWSNPQCKAQARCPLPDEFGKTFVGGSYDEVVLSKPTRLYRVHADDKAALGNSDKLHSYWSRSESRGTQATIEKGIDVARTGNTAHKQVVIELPAGTRIYEGRVAPNLGRTQVDRRGAPGIGTQVGGGNQVVLDVKVKPEWIVERR